MLGTSSDHNKTDQPSFPSHSLKCYGQLCVEIVSNAALETKTIITDRACSNVKYKVVGYFNKRRAIVRSVRSKTWIGISS